MLDLRQSSFCSFVSPGLLATPPGDANHAQSLHPPRPRPPRPHLHPRSGGLPGQRPARRPDRLPPSPHSRPGGAARRDREPDLRRHHRQHHHRHRQPRHRRRILLRRRRHRLRHRVLRLGCQQHRQRGLLRGHRRLRQRGL